MKVSFLASAVAFVAVLGVSRAANPSPEELRWNSAVKTFVDVLSGSAEKSSLDKLLSDHSWVAPFARNRTESVSILPDLVGGMRVVSAHGYLQPSVTSATDLAADVAADAAVADVIRKRLAVPEGSDLGQANATMARWFSTALDAQPGDPVALLAFYDEGQTASPGVAATTPSLTLLLVRGEFAADGAPRISRVLYGSLDAAVR